MVVVAILAILGAIGITMVSGSLDGAKIGTATANLEYLNRAVIAYEHAGAEITNGTGAASNVIALLKTRDVSLPGSPFVETNIAIQITSSQTEYRAAWNGTRFELLEPGQAGSGQNLSTMQRK